jgi:hypothetical protein
MRTRLGFLLEVRSGSKGDIRWLPGQVCFTPGAAIREYGRDVCFVRILLQKSKTEQP